MTNYNYLLLTKLSTTGLLVTSILVIPPIFIFYLIQSKKTLIGTLIYNHSVYLLTFGNFVYIIRFTHFTHMIYFVHIILYIIRFAYSIHINLIVYIHMGRPPA